MGCQLGSGWHTRFGTDSTTFWKMSGLLGETPTPNTALPGSLGVRKLLLGTSSPGRSGACPQAVLRVGGQWGGHMHRAQILCLGREKKRCLQKDAENLELQRDPFWALGGLVPSLGPRETPEALK